MILIVVKKNNGYKLWCEKLEMNWREIITFLFTLLRHPFAPGSVPSACSSLMVQEVLAQLRQFNIDDMPELTNATGSPFGAYGFQENGGKETIV